MISTYTAPAYFGPSLSRQFDNHVHGQSAARVSSLPPRDKGHNVMTEGKAIHISNLPFRTETKDLKALLRPFGQVEVNIRRAKDKRCSATAQYASSIHAETAIRSLHEYVYGNRRLVVRLDRNEVGSTSNSPSCQGSDSDGSEGSTNAIQRNRLPKRTTGPLIVNGAANSQHKRRLSSNKGSPGRSDRTSDSDDESDDD